MHVLGCSGCRISTTTSEPCPWERAMIPTSSASGTLEREGRGSRSERVDHRRMEWDLWCGECWANPALSLVGRGGTEGIRAVPDNKSNFFYCQPSFFFFFSTFQYVSMYCWSFCSPVRFLVHLSPLPFGASSSGWREQLPLHLSPVEHVRSTTYL